MGATKNECINFDFTDCSCRALERNNCIGCSFYSTRVDAVKRRRKAYERLRNLPTNVQSYFAEKYYAGNAPWVRSEQ